MDPNVEDFYGCYLLVCENPRYKGRTYIGYTRDPNRRIRQHNTGKHAGGAWKTSGKGPWAMVLIVHGFPNDIAALRFEWAWQHPDRSRRLRALAAKLRTETAFEYRLRIVSTMLRSGPWSRLPLTVRWLIQEYRKDLHPSRQPPLHMAMAFGPVKAVNKVVSKKTGAADKENVCLSDGDGDGTHDVDVDVDVDVEECAVCDKPVSSKETDAVSCLHRCGATSHLLCLARYFLRSSEGLQLLPVEGECPECGRSALWGDLIRFKKGFYRSLTEDDAGEHWANELASQAPT